MKMMATNAKLFTRILLRSFIVGTLAAKNNAFVAQRRNDVRTLLRLAYVQRQLPHTGSATLTAFGAAAEQEPAEDTDSDFEMLT